MEDFQDVFQNIEQKNENKNKYILQDFNSHNKLTIYIQIYSSFILNDTNYYCSARTKVFWGRINNL